MEQNSGYTGQQSGATNFSNSNSNRDLQNIQNGIQSLGIDQSGSVLRPPLISKDKRKKRSHVFLNLTPATNFHEEEDNFDPNAAAHSAGIPSLQYSQYSNSNFNGLNPSAATIGGPGLRHIRSMDELEPLTKSKNDASGSQIQLNRNVAQASNFQDQPSEESLSVPAVRHTMDQHYKSNTFYTFENVSPPPAGTQLRVVDQGNASPKFARMTMYSVPSSEQLRASTKIPLGMLIRPFAPIEEGESPVPEVDLRTASSVPRCRRCRAYINPAMQHTGYTMVCNICSFSSSVPQEYLSSVDSNGVRSDRTQRPELHCGVVDFLVPDFYNLDENKPPAPLHFVFLVDLSSQSDKLKLREAISGSIEGALYNLGESRLPEGSKIAIVGYDTKLHFYNLSPELEQTSMATVSDIDDPFLPFYRGLFADPMESYSIIDSTLRSIEQGAHFPGAEPAYGPALQAAKLLLNEVGGGQVIAFLSSLPSWGPGALTVKLPQGKTPAEYDKDILTSDNKFYQDLIKEFTKSNIGLNLLVASEIPVDLANAGIVAIKTGGLVRLWNKFDINRDESGLYQCVRDIVAQSTGYQGQLKVRCSAGLQVKKYFGPIDQAAGSDAPIIPILSSETSVACSFEYDGKLDTKTDAHFQAALLYTSAEGVRKVRVINTIMSVTERVADVFNFADQDAVLALMLRENLNRVPSSNLVALKSTLTVQLVDIISSYKTLVAANNNYPGQLILPVGLRTLPMFVLAVLKSKALRDRVANPDLRVESLFYMQTFPAAKLSVYLYPVLVSLHNLDDIDCTYDSQTGSFNMPRGTPISQQSLEFGGAYLVFNTKYIYIWLHSDVNPLLLQDLFGEPYTSLEDLDASMSVLPQLDTHISLQVRNLSSFLCVHYLNSESFPIQICRFKMDRNEGDFVELLYEDKSASLTWSYQEYLAHLHKQILAKASSETGNGSKGNQDSVSLAQRFSIF